MNWPGVTPVTAVAVLCAGAAAHLAVGGRPYVRRRARALFGPEEEVGAAARWRARLRGAGATRHADAEATSAGAAASGTGEERRWRLGRRGVLGPEVWCLPAGLALGALGGSVLPVLASPVALFLVRRWLVTRDAERARDRRAAEVITLCATVAGELRAGRQPVQALAAVRLPGLGAAGSAVVAAARYGGDVPQALRAAARLPGGEGLTGMAACWQVAVEGGAALASGLERIAAGLRAQRDQRDELRAQLAGPRATALMLALLPAGGLLMGSALGADPLRVLLHTPAGWGCLVAGGLLEWGGVVWTARIVAAAEGARKAEETGANRKGESWRQKLSTGWG
ncbi:type II secretion system F family protein [Streptomyces lydicus]|uniref:type II secretion system F family protein n=1 Tax=Streptomyces lydicus TaxID=47763 RepID=UPI000981A944|nr:type II secretion system F family protein [Streptomyces lydicus]